MTKKEKREDIGGKIGGRRDPRNKRRQIRERHWRIEERRIERREKR